MSLVSKWENSALFIVTKYRARLFSFFYDKAILAALERMMFDIHRPPTSDKK